MQSRNAQPNYSLMDGISVLQALATSEEPIGSRELARRLNLETTRANRLLRTLAYIGIARQTPNRKYTAGPGMFVLAAQSLFASGILDTAMPQLERLRRFNLTVALGVLWMDTVSYLYHARPGMSSIEALGRIGIYPASKGAIGLALLAAHDDAYIEQLYQDRPIVGFDDVEALLVRVRQIREDGYVHNPVADRPGDHSLAIAIGDPPHMAVGLSGWIPESLVEELRPFLKEIALEIDRAGAQRSVTKRTRD